jgi:FMN reductase
MAPDRSRPLVVGLGGSLRRGSTTEAVLKYALTAVEAADVQVLMLGGRELDFPAYAPSENRGSDAARAMVHAVREADGILLASPGYHGTISGLMKNALDYLEELREDDPPYLSGRPVGCISTAFGWQAAVNTLSSLRQTVHALRGWPTPLGVPVNTAQGCVDPTGTIVDLKLERALTTVAAEVVNFIAADGRKHARIR